MAEIVIEKEIGKGASGKVFQGRMTDQDLDVAVKIVPSQFHNHLHKEFIILESLPRCKYFPKPIWFGRQNGKSTMLTELLGITLSQYNITVTPPLETCYLKVKSILKAIHILHRIGYIHKDIKPTNICMHGKENQRIGLIDFGLSEKFLDGNNKHSKRNTVSFEGNLEFASENVICGISPSRRDDLESLCYIAIYLHKKDLPWIVDGLTRNNAIGLRINSRIKLIKNLPSEVVSALEYCQSLKYEEKPDYSFLSRMFRAAARKTGQNPYIFQISSEKKKKKMNENAKRDLIAEFITVISALPEMTQETKKRISDI